MPPRYERERRGKAGSAPRRRDHARRHPSALRGLGLQRSAPPGFLGRHRARARTLRRVVPGPRRRALWRRRSSGVGHRGRRIAREAPGQVGAHLLRAGRQSLHLQLLGSRSRAPGARGAIPCRSRRSGMRPVQRAVPRQPWLLPAPLHSGPGSEWPLPRRPGLREYVGTRQDARVASTPRGSRSPWEIPREANPSGGMPSAKCSTSP